MTSPTQLMLPSLAAVLAVLLSGTSTATRAQTGKPTISSSPAHRGDTMTGPHHVLAMAYRDNLTTFTRAVQQHAARAKTIDHDFARPAVVEMRRSFEQMQLHHTAQMSPMRDHMTPMVGDSMKHPVSSSQSMKPTMAMKPTSAMMQDMQTHMTALAEHLTALESEVNASEPSPKSVSAHTAEILKHCAGMSGMPTKAKSGAVKPKQHK